MLDEPLDEMTRPKTVFTQRTKTAFYTMLGLAAIDAIAIPLVALVIYGFIDTRFRFGASWRAAVIIAVPVITTTFLAFIFRSWKNCKIVVTPDGWAVTIATGETRRFPYADFLQLELISSDTGRDYRLTFRSGGSIDLSRNYEDYEYLHHLARAICFKNKGQSGPETQLPYPPQTP